MISAAEDLSSAGSLFNAVSEVAELPLLTEAQTRLAIEAVFRVCSPRLTLFNGEFGEICAEGFGEGSATT